jgi:hypothetical protein
VGLWVYHDTAYATDPDRVQVQVSTDGTTWTDVGTAINRYDGTTGWKQHSVSLTSYIGQSIYVGLHAISAYGNDVHIDDVSLDYVAPGSCTAHACTPAVGPKPVPDGRLSGTAMKGTRITTNGGTISVTYDTSTCSVADHSILYGNLANVSTLTLSGSVCSIGNASPYSWTTVPTGYNVFWVIVGDGGATESSWGQHYTGGAYGERSTTASNQCGNTAIDTNGTCP